MAGKLPYNIWKLFIPVAIGITICLLPKPEAVDPKGWQLFGIFVATIGGIVLKPLPMPAVALIGLLACIITNTLNLSEQAFQGFSSPIVWLVVFIFFIARGFIKTKLGHRIAYSFVALLGKNTLGLGYGIILTELVMGPAIPSNSARAGGIIYPIVKSISETLGSRPEDGTARRLGSFLTLVAFQGNLIVSSMFLTAMAANPMAQNIAAEQGVHFTWTDWFMAALVPGVCSIILVPLVLFIIYPPQLKVLPQAVSIAKKNLRDMGPMTVQEWAMTGVFIIMLAMWTIGEKYGIPTASAGLLGVCTLLLTGIITWKDILEEHEAWSTVIWLSILIMMSDYLKIFGLTGWFSQEIGNIFAGYHSITALYGLALVYFYSHYFFASNTAHIGAMYGAFLTVAIIAGAPPVVSALLLGFFSSLFSSMTHYSTGSAPIYFGMGYVPVSDWWLYGLIISVLNITIWLGVGYFWWSFLGLM
jgi:divalent anion:Na+ symporter, DASS family